MFDLLKNLYLIASDHHGGIIMLFRKKHPRSCEYCVHSTSISDEHTLCVKHGIRAKDVPCRKFRYDPLKRVPPKAKPLDVSQYSSDDFVL